MCSMFNQNELKRDTTTTFKYKMKSVTTASWDMASLGSLESRSISICFSLPLNPFKKQNAQTNNQIQKWATTSKKFGQQKHKCLYES